MDNKCRAGSRVSLPVDVPGALLSLGDVHFAQGDGEACGQGLEMQSTVQLCLNLRKAGDVRWKHRFPVIEAARPASRRTGTCLVTSGIPIDSDGNNHDLDLTLAARNALLDMLSYLTGVRGLTQEQAYALTSVAVDLHITQAVNNPNVLVSAVLPLDIFEDES